MHQDLFGKIFTVAKCNFREKKTVAKKLPLNLRRGSVSESQVQTTPMTSGV